MGYKRIQHKRDRSLTPPPLFESAVVDEDAPPLVKVPTINIRNEMMESKPIIEFPNTPTSINTTVTLIGIPHHRQDSILDQITTIGPITNISRSDKTDANWIVVTFLHGSSVDLILEWDGRLYDSSWVLVVRKGDCFGTVKSPGI
jgi:hypothetical protein